MAPKKKSGSNATATAGASKTGECPRCYVIFNAQRCGRLRGGNIRCPNDGCHHEGPPQAFGVSK